MGAPIRSVAGGLWMAVGRPPDRFEVLGKGSLALSFLSPFFQTSSCTRPVAAQSKTRKQTNRSAQPSRCINYNKDDEEEGALHAMRPKVDSSATRREANEKQ